jgi:osmoprotectant transport system ATP-binding protein
MIELRDLRKDFGAKTVINGVNLRVRRGEKLVLLGPSGCGKTTLLRMINRLIEPTSGSVWVDGIDNGQRNPVLLRRKLGYVVQDGGLLPHRTVRENIFTVPHLLGWSPQQCEDRLFIMKAILWLFDGWFEMFPHELSGGQRQRVALARALIADPLGLLMDEPFSGLDPVTRQLIRREVRGLWALQDKTIIMVTHDIVEAFEFGDRVALMSPGTIEQVGTPTELLFRPRNEFVRNFFNPIERMHHEWQAVRLKDLDLGLSPGSSPSPSTKPDLPAASTFAEAMAALDGDATRSSALLEAFQRYKTTVQTAAREPDSKHP